MADEGKAVRQHLPPLQGESSFERWQVLSKPDFFLQPQVAWYEGEGKTKGEVPPISLEFVKQGQKEMKPTDWSEAWLQYQDYVTNSPLEAADIMYRLGDDPYKERGKKDDWQHLR